jgi:hypothetical protein
MDSYSNEVGVEAQIGTVQYVYFTYYWFSDFILPAVKLNMY